eukprot:1215963-Rhodomonas_salina.1
MVCLPSALLGPGRIWPEKWVSVELKVCQDLQVSWALLENGGNNLLVKRAVADIRENSFADVFRCMSRLKVVLKWQEEPEEDAGLDSEELRACAATWVRFHNAQRIPQHGVPSLEHKRRRTSLGEAGGGGWGAEGRPGCESRAERGEDMRLA